MTVFMKNYALPYINRVCTQYRHHIITGIQARSTICRLMTIKASSIDKSMGNNKIDGILVYRRRSDRRLWPRLMLGSAMSHNLYWLWYVFDFLPAVGNIDGTVGYLGLGIATFINVGTLLYPRSLISEIRVKPVKSDEPANIIVKTHTLLMTPSRPQEYGHGKIILDSPKDLTNIFTSFSGDIRGFDGHLPLQADGLYMNLLLHLNPENSEEVLDKDLLLSFLVTSRLVGYNVLGKSKFEKAIGTCEVPIERSNHKVNLPGKVKRKQRRAGTRYHYNQ